MVHAKGRYFLHLALEAAHIMTTRWEPSVHNSKDFVSFDGACQSLPDWTQTDTLKRTVPTSIHLWWEEVLHGEMGNAPSPPQSRLWVQSEGWCCRSANVAAGQVQPYEWNGWEKVCCFELLGRRVGSKYDS